MRFRLDGRGGRFARSSAARAADQAETLLAAADSLTANYELTQGSLAGRLFYSRALEVGYREIGGSEWPYEGALAEVENPLIRDDRGVVFELPDGTLAWLSAGHGWFHATVAAPTRDAVTKAFAAFAEQYPALYREAIDDQTVPITFWTDSKYGPVSRLRIIDASPWADIERNYSAEVRDELGPLMTDFEPGKSGQLLLWQGPPGTGKSWALRALASEWRDWAEFNYITDPDAFFVTNPSYLIDVLLHESYEELVVIEEEGDAELVSTDKLGKWRVLILEDTGELLAANAKESYGQGLSRLLNVVDGLVGQGLRVLVLVTTNDELGELHPAVKRPGRCASQIEFGPLSAEDASAWLGEETDEGGTLAELYARRGEGEEALADAADIPEALASIAEEHAPDGGYGETAWNAGTSTVFWVSADWSSNEEVDAAEAAFLAVDGVDHFEYEAEAALPEGDGWETVWPTASLSASAVDGSNGAMVALFPTPPQADALAIEGGQPANELHVTLVYLGKADEVDLAKVEEALGADLGKPLSGEAGEVFQFSEGEDGTPLNVSPDVPGLAEFRAEVLRRLEAAGIEDASSHPDWVPHICIGYDNDPSEAADKVGLPLSFDSVAVVVGGDRTNVPLTASANVSPAERWDRLARELEAELDEEPARNGSRTEALTAAVEALVASSPMTQLATAHEKTLASVNALLASAAGEAEVDGLRERAQRGDALAARALGVLAEFARKPTPAPHFHVNVPEQQAPDVHVQVDAPTISPPDVQVTVEPPSLTVQAPPAPNVEVRPEIRVEAAKAPDVRVEPPAVHVTVESPRPSAVRAIKEDDGSTVFTVEPDDFDEE